MKLEHLSASRIETFYQCPLKYWAIYEKEMEETPHPLTNMGSAEHEMLKLATRARMAGERRVRMHDPLVFRDAAMRKFKVEAQYAPLLDELTGNALKWGYFRNLARTVGCELKFSFALEDGTEVTGFIDRLDIAPPEADIIDIKTQKSQFTGEELRESWQARIYNIAARRMFLEVSGKVSVSFWVLRHMVQKIWLGPHDAEADCRRLVEVAREIRVSDGRQGKPSGLCPYCPYKECPAARMGLKERLRRWHPRV